MMPLAFLGYDLMRWFASHVMGARTALSASWDELSVRADRAVRAPRVEVLVNPGVGRVGQYLAFEIDFDAFFERHSLGVAQVGVRFGLALTVTADFGGLVALVQRVERTALSSLSSASHLQNIRRVRDFTEPRNCQTHSGVSGVVALVLELPLRCRHITRTTSALLTDQLSKTSLEVCTPLIGSN